MPVGRLLDRRSPRARVKRQLALRPLHLHRLARRPSPSRPRDGDRLLADARHGSPLRSSPAASSPSEHAAEHFAADVLLARARSPTSRPWASTGSRRRARWRRVGRSRDRRIDAPARLRHALDLADHRLAVEILELDLELGAGRSSGRRARSRGYSLPRASTSSTRARSFEAGVVTFGRRALLRIADAGQHIAERIVHRHRSVLLYQLDLTMPGIRPWRRQFAQRDAATCCSLR